MKLLYENRTGQDKNFIQEVCHNILSKPLIEKEHSNLFNGIFVEGRNRRCCYEDLAAITSFKLYSKYNYPIFCFLSNKNFFAEVNQQTLNDFRIKIIEIPEINSLEEYTKFCVKKLYFTLPDNVENIVTLQPDGMLLKEGWENFIITSGVDWLSPHWRHFASIEISNSQTGWQWYEQIMSPTMIGNGGFSFRKVSKMKNISSIFGLNDLESQREKGRYDNRIPMEDLFFCYWGFGCGIMKLPTLRQCDRWACDPLTPKIYSNNKPFGFHFFKDLSEPDWPECNHN